MEETQAEGAPCICACPAVIDIPRCHRLISEAKWNEALAVIRERVPFPGVLGRVCFSPCENQCKLNEVKRKPVAIRALHRVVAEKASVVPELPAAEPTGKKVAIVGSGPAGLTAGYYLAKRGHSVTVFEALPQPGGMMRVGIPEYRLPKEILASEVEDIKRVGVDIKTNTKVDSVDKLLKDGYNAVLVAIGAHKGVSMRIEGEDTTGVIDCISLLRDVNLGKEVRVEERIAVIGGGNSAVDAARTSLRLGAKDVTIMYRRSEVEMPANLADVEEAKREGVKIQFLAAPTKIRTLNGKIQMDCVQMKLSNELDASGRRIPKPIPDSEFTIDIDMVISAIGEVPDISTQFGLAISDKTTLEVTPDTLATTRAGVFAAGDAVRGPASVIEAIADGRQAAISIDKYLDGKGISDEVLAPPEGMKMPQVGLSYYDRALLAQLPIGERLASFAEVEISLTGEMGMEEAARCLWCDLQSIVVDASKCAECRCCQLACSFAYTGAFNPQRAMIVVETPTGMNWQRVISFSDECVKCSVCARACTYDALSTVKIERR